MSQSKESSRLIHIAVNNHTIEGNYDGIQEARSIILLAHGTGDSRLCPRNQCIIGRLRDHGFNTLLIDLLTQSEKNLDIQTQRPRFDIERLGERIVHVVDWLEEMPENQDLNLGCLASNTAAAAALLAAEARPMKVKAVVSLDGRVDMAASILGRIRAPTLCIVGELDLDLLALNRRALSMTKAETRLEILKDTRRAFEKSEMLNELADLVQAWFLRHLTQHQSSLMVN